MKPLIKPRYTVRTMKARIPRMRPRNSLSMTGLVR